MADATFPILAGKALLVMVIGIGVVLFARRLFLIFRLVWAGRQGTGLDQPLRRISLALLLVFLQTRVLRDRAAGIAHVTIFYGFLVISLGTLNQLWRGFLGESLLPSVTGSSYFLVLQDIFAVSVIAAVGAIAYRRSVVRLPSVRNSPASTLILTLIFFLMVTLLLMEATEYQLGASAGASPIGALLSVALVGLNSSQLVVLGGAAWWLHVWLLVGFLILIPHSKHMHILACPINEVLRSLRPKGQLQSADVNSPAPIGVGTFNQFTRKQLVDLFTCTECGRCLQYCPTYASGGTLIPRQMILDLRKGLLDNRRDEPIFRSGENEANPRQSLVPVVADAMGREAVWACTTCGACQEHCPVFIEHVDKVVDARRFLVEIGEASPSLSRALEGLASLGNPQMLPPAARGSSLETLKIPQVEPSTKPEIVYWLGCAGGYEPKAQEIAVAMVKIMRAARVDFAILGASEVCCGDPARRTGEEGLFQELTRRNLETFDRLGVKKLLTTCPHCYNTFSNEYPEFGAQFSVVHHSDFIRDLVAANRIELTRKLDQPVTFQDPCYLGRYNGMYSSPREILELACGGGVLEMQRNRDRAFCCGGGGGQMYLETITETKTSRLRFAEARSLPVSTLATACPFCKIMLDDAAQYEAGAHRVRVKDIAELVCESAQL